MLTNLSAQLDAERSVNKFGVLRRAKGRVRYHKIPYGI